MTIKKLLVAAAIVAVSTSAVANDNHKVNFEKTYSAFQQALNEQAESSKLVELAQQSYQTGEKYFGTGNINTANLKMSYLNLVPLETLRSVEAQQLADSALEAYRQHYQADAPELIGALQMVLSTRDSSSDMNKLKDIFYELIDVADANMASQPEVMLREKVDAGAQMLRLGSRASSELVEFAEAANKQFGGEHELTLLASFHAGRYLEAKGEVEQAVANFQKLTAVEKVPRNLSYPKYISHARLVNHLEKLGRSDEATEHCVVIANLGYGIGEEREPQPLYRVNPKYPSSLASLERGGKVTMKFDINAIGMVENIEIVESDYKALANVSIEAIKQWRYAPYVKDGKPAVATGRMVQMVFEME